MNIFYLDEDLDRCAEYHIDKHVGQMQKEGTQLLCTTLWVDKYIGYAPRKLESEELNVINLHKADEPPIDERVFTGYLPTHINSPCAIWTRTSLEHFNWLVCYVNALNSESRYRGYAFQKACDIANALPDPVNLPDIGWSEPPQCMPDEYKMRCTHMAYRMYYLRDKAEFASWKVRGAPPWWNPL